LALKLREEVATPELINQYRRAYESHMAQAQVYKDVLEDIAASITTGLGKPKITYTRKMADTMRTVLRKKQD